MTSTRTKARRHARRRMCRGAFTLIEMVIVIGIIVVLAGLTLAVSVAVTQGAEIRQTEATIELLNAALREWESQSDRQVTFGVPNQPFTNARYDIVEPSGIGPDEMNQMTGELMTILGRNASAREIVARITPDFVDRYVDSNGVEHMLIRDAWGEPIVAVFPGREWVFNPDSGDGVIRDADGTIRTVFEEGCGVAVNRQICFLSAGPDGLIGDLGAAPDTPKFAEAQDNLYSYAPINPSDQ